MIRTSLYMDGFSSIPKSVNVKYLVDDLIRAARFLTSVFPADGLNESLGWYGIDFSTFKDQDIMGFTNGAPVPVQVDAYRKIVLKAVDSGASPSEFRLYRTLVDAEPMTSGGQSVATMAPIDVTVQPGRVEPMTSAGQEVAQSAPPSFVQAAPAPTAPGGSSETPQDSNTEEEDEKPAPANAAGDVPPVASGGQTVASPAPANTGDELNTEDPSGSDPQGLMDPADATQADLMASQPTASGTATGAGEPVNSGATPENSQKSGDEQWVGGEMPDTPMVPTPDPLGADNELTGYIDVDNTCPECGNPLEQGGSCGYCKGGYEGAVPQDVASELATAPVNSEPHVAVPPYTEPTPAEPVTPPAAPAQGYLGQGILEAPGKIAAAITGSGYLGQGILEAPGKIAAAITGKGYIGALAAGAAGALAAGAAKPKPTGAESGYVDDPNGVMPTPAPEPPQEVGPAGVEPVVPFTQETVAPLIDSKKRMVKTFADTETIRASVPVVISLIGLYGDKFYLLINGRKYAYTAPNIGDVANSFVGMLKHGAVGRALLYLKKNTQLVEGGRGLPEVTIPVFEGLIWNKNGKYYIATCDGRLGTFSKSSQLGFTFVSKYGDMKKTMWYSKEAGDVAIKIQFKDYVKFSELCDRTKDSAAEYKYENRGRYILFGGKDSRVVLPFQSRSTDGFFVINLYFRHGQFVWETPKGWTSPATDLKGVLQEVNAINAKSAIPKLPVEVWAQYHAGTGQEGNLKVAVDPAKFGQRWKAATDPTLERERWETTAYLRRPLLRSF